MKLADYVVDYIVSLGVKNVFMVTGGAIIHVTDAVGRRSQEKHDISYTCVQHEQAGAMAAEAYSRLGPGMGVVLATSGPGATNLITGICGCWFDSIPAIFLTGQVATKESLGSTKMKPRQVGFQETDIVSMVCGVTKFASVVTDSSQIRYSLEKAVYLARTGRPGPVPLDLPVDVQVADVEPEELVGFDPKEITENTDANLDSEDVLKEKIEQIIGLIDSAQRPVILLGSGVRLGHAEREARECIEKIGIPVVVSWGAFDILPHNHPQFVGAIGVYGNRGANFAVQNSDLLISLGSRLDTRQTGGRVNYFARQAKKVMVDIDQNEILKGRGLVIDLPVLSDIKEFLTLFLNRVSAYKGPDISSWIDRTKQWRTKYPAVLPEYYNEKESINAYVFLKMLSDEIGENQTIIVDEGGHLTWTMQSFEMREGQRLISTFGNSPMGYALPAAIGASIALGKKPIVCIDGDGGFQMNIQELQTVASYQLPIKMFIINNRSMGIIKQFQDLYFDSRYIASSPAGGYTSPDFTKVAESYGIETVSIKRLDGAKENIKKVLTCPRPILCDVWINESQKINPKIEFGRPLEDMAPYLDRKEFMENMIIEPLAESKEIPKHTGWVTLK